MSGSEPKHTITNDDEAADLLMLLSHQPKTQPIVKQEVTSQPPAVVSNIAPKTAPAPAPTPTPPTTTMQRSVSTSLTKETITTNMNFSHRRSTSTSSNSSNSSNKLRMDKITTSPGPASAALFCGNGSDRAKIAAAALAAAAATPLPIIHKAQNEDRANKLDLPFNNSVTNSVSNTASSAIATGESLAKSLSPLSCSNIEPNGAVLVKPIKGAGPETDKKSLANINAFAEEGNIKVEENQDMHDTPPAKTETGVLKKNHNTTKLIVNKNEDHTEENNDEVEDDHQDTEDGKLGEDPSVSVSYAVDPDSGIIGCICGFDHDDGLTIQCDKCFRWQHLVCMGFETIDETPDDYQCNLCNKNFKVNVEKAKKLQLAYLDKENPKRKRNSPYVVESPNDINRNVGTPNFKKRKKNTENYSNDVEKYKTLYYPIDYLIFKSSSIKMVTDQLLSSYKRDRSVIRLDTSQIGRLEMAESLFKIKKTTEPKAKSSINDSINVKFNLISKLSLYTKKSIKHNSFISLMTGELDIKQNYICDKINKYWILGCPKPNVFFHSSLPIIIDQRGLGNLTRFIRKSCKPNCEIKTVLINKNELGFAVYSTKDIKSDQELTLPWEWDIDHPILKFLNNTTSAGNSSIFDNMDSDTRITLLNSIHSILEITECACAASNDCVFRKIDKLSSHLQRNTRKNLVFNALPNPSPNQHHVPIQERFKIRDEFLLSKIEGENGGNNNAIEKDNEVQENMHNKSEIIDESHNDSIVSNESINEDSDDIVFKFKPKAKNSIYNLHILPKQIELMKKYQAELINHSTENSKENQVSESTSDDMISIPIEIDPKILSKLSKPKISSIEANLNLTEKSNDRINSLNKAEIEEKPKVIRKFSLADYKKKKTG